MKKKTLINISIPRISILLLVLVLLMSGCAAPDSAPEKQKEAADTIKVVDMAGLEVEIPADTAHNTVATTYGVITPFYVTLNISDRVLATTIKNKAFLRKVDTDIINTSDIGNRAIDAELLAALSPDILMVRVTDEDKKEVGEQLNIPTVMVYIETGEQVIEAYELTGKMFGREERAAELIDWIKTEQEHIRELSASIPEEERKTVLCLGSTLGKVAGSNMLQVRMIEDAGGLSEVTEVADDLMWVDVGVESVFAKDPEYIFVTSSHPCDYTIDQLYEDSAWSGMRAVKDKHIFYIPAKMDSWDMPGPAFVLGTYYMMHCMYPELVSTEMMQQKTDEYYQLFYGRTFTGEEINYYF